MGTDITQLHIAVAVAARNAQRYFEVYRRTRDLKKFQRGIFWLNVISQHQQKLESLLGLAK